MDSIIPLVSVIPLTLFSSQLSLSSTLWGLKATGLSSRAGAPMKGLQWAASCLNFNAHRLMESCHSHTISLWFGILPQFASRTLCWCLLYFLFPCDLTSPHRTSNATMETERKCTSSQHTGWSRSLQFKMGNTVTWNPTLTNSGGQSFDFYNISFLYKCLISEVMNTKKCKKKKKRKKMNVLSCWLFLGLICKCQLKASSESC